MKDLLLPVKYTVDSAKNKKIKKSTNTDVSDTVTGCIFLQAHLSFPFIKMLPDNYLRKAAIVIY